MCECTLAGSSRAAYPVFILLGIAAGYLTSRYVFLPMHWKKRPAGPLTAGDLHVCILGALPGIVIGARIFYVLLHWSYYSPNPISVLYLWEGGFVFHGGLAGGFAASAAVCRIRRIRWLETADLAAAPISLGYAVGRIGCFFNGCCAGIPSMHPWAMVFPILGPDPRHPAQLYAAAAGLVLFILLFLIYRRTASVSRTFGWFLLLHGIYRIVIEQIRYEPVVIFFMTHGEFFSILMIIAGLAVIRRSIFTRTSEGRYEI